MSVHRDTTTPKLVTKDVQDTSHPYTIPEQNNDKTTDVPLTVNNHKNAGLDDKSTSTDVGIPDIPLHTKTCKSRQGGFPIRR